MVEITKGAGAGDIRCAMSNMPYSYGLTPRGGPSITVEQIVKYLEDLGETLRINAEIQNRDEVALRTLRNQQRAVGAFLREAIGRSQS